MIPAFHAGNTGSNPVGDAKENKGLAREADPFFFFPELRGCPVD